MRSYSNLLRNSMTLIFFLENLKNKKKIRTENEIIEWYPFWRLEKNIKNLQSWTAWNDKMFWVTDYGVYHHSISDCWGMHAKKGNYMFKNVCRIENLLLWLVWYKVVIKIMIVCSFYAGKSSNKWVICTHNVAMLFLLLFFCDKFICK